MGKEAELIRAAKTGDLKLLERLLGQHGKRASVMGSIRKSLNPNLQDELGYTLLHHATLNGHREVVSFLLRCSASTTIPDCSGSYPLHLAAWKGDFEIVRLLVQQGPSRANVNQNNNSDDTALHLAAQYGYCGVVEFLLERHANPMMKNVRGETPLDLAAQFGHLDTVHVLISHCPEILRLSRPDTSPLHLAARNGHSLVVLSLINGGTSINTVCTTGSALHEASRCGKEDTVKLLLDKGIDVNLKDANGKTALGLLSDFPARRARVIHRLISDYIDARRKPTTRYMKPRSYRLLAVPVKDGRGLDESSDLPLLRYRKGDAIVIQCCMKHQRWVGALDGVTGVFNIDDTRIFQDIDGKLHEVMKTQLLVSEEDGSVVVRQQHADDTHIHTRIKEGDVTSTAAAATDTPPAQDKKKVKKKKSKMSAEQKRFVLSRDTGAYSQLNPVTAQEASSSDQVEVKQLHSPQEADSNVQKGGFIGNYYLLDLDNFADKKNDTAGKEVETEVKKKEEENERRLPQPAQSQPHRPAYENVVLSLSSADPLDVSMERHHPAADMNQVTSHSHNGGQDVVRASVPIAIPSSSSTKQQRKKRISFANDHTGEGDGDGDGERRFRIAECQHNDDVMVSRLNPNYEHVELKKGKTSQHTTYDDRAQMPLPPASESVHIISSDDNPFAGLVQSCSDSGDAFPRQRLQSVWDDLRVDKEWNQIDDMLKDMTGVITQYSDSLPCPATTGDGDLTTWSHDTNAAGQSSVSLWLKGVGLAGYSSTLESNGFDNIQFMGGGILTLEDLADMGITDQNDQYTIMAAAILLPSPPAVRHAQSVSEWLSLLQLNSLEDRFRDYTLDTISTLWDIQLTTVLGVELLGHRKRLQYGIRELSQTHLPSQYKPRQGPPSPIIGFKFTQDYRNLQSLRKSSGDIRYEKSLTVRMDRPVSSPVHYGSPPRDRRVNHTSSPSIATTATTATGGSGVINMPSSQPRNYHTWYLGSALVKGTPGKHSAEEACLRLKTKTDGIAKVPQIILSISWKGVWFMDASSKRVVSTHYIQDISHCCCDIEDGRVFTYMTKDKDSGHSYCHVFMVQSKDIADEIILTVGQAFEVAYQAVVRARGGGGAQNTTDVPSSKPPQKCNSNTRLPVPVT